MSSAPGAPGNGALPPGEQTEVEIPSRPVAVLRQTLGSPLLFSIVYLAIASSIYFALGVIAGHALGLTPIVFLVAALMFALTSMTYVEGASLHQERGGSTVFARYAFNELVSFIAGWAILLEYVILIAVTTYAATQYLQRLLGHARQRARGAGARAGVHRVCRAREHPRAWRSPGATDRDARDHRPDAAGGDRRARPRAVPAPARARVLDPPGQRAELVTPRVRAHDRRDRAYGPRDRVRARRRGEDRPPRAQARRQELEPDGRGGLCRDRAGRDHARCRCTAATPSWRPATRASRSSASSRRSVPTGWPKRCATSWPRWRRSR